MNLFFDTNVILDWVLAREHAFGKEAKSIVRLAEEGKVKLFMAGGSVYTIVYVLEKSGSKSEKLRQTLLKILQLIHVVSDNTQHYIAGGLSQFNDLEDAFQYHLALSKTDLNFFITGNIKDYAPFVDKALPVQTPKKFLELLG